jgi:hypothetical protein
MNKNIFIYVDESGTLPDPKSPVVIIAAVATYAPHQLILPKKSAAKALGKKNVKEIKFYKAGINTKIKFLTVLAKLDIKIFVLILEKNGKKIPDSPENFAIACSLILYDCLYCYQNSFKSIIFDRHFHNQTDQEKFDSTLKKLVGENLNIIHADSLKEAAVNTADMVAGSVLWKRTGKDDQFYKIIKNKIVEEKAIDWKEVKKWFINKKLARTGVNTHPNE